MIEVRNLTKRYGSQLAVDDLSFTISPGKVTGFLGPNGAGKSTTIRLILGLDRPDSGQATINGRRYRDMALPLRMVGALLDVRATHTGRTAYNHLLCLAQSQGLPTRRVSEVISLTGLTKMAKKRASALSLGMAQRLGIASALLGNPRVLLLDEPVNGLDPEGVQWIRLLMKQLAAEGRTVFLSSHLMSEMAVTADHLIVINTGMLLADCSTADFMEKYSSSQVLVKTSGAAKLSELIVAEGAQVTHDAADTLTVTGMPEQRIAELAAWGRLIVFELSPQRVSLERAFLDLTADGRKSGPKRSASHSATDAAMTGSRINRYDRSAR